MVEGAVATRLSRFTAKASSPSSKAAADDDAVEGVAALDEEEDDDADVVEGAVAPRSRSSRCTAIVDYSSSEAGFEAGYEDEAVEGTLAASEEEAPREYCKQQHKREQRRENTQERREREREQLQRREVNLLGVRTFSVGRSFIGGGARGDGDDGGRGGVRGARADPLRAHHRGATCEAVIASSLSRLKGHDVGSRPGGTDKETAREEGRKGEHRRDRARGRQARGQAPHIAGEKCEQVHQNAAHRGRGLAVVYESISGREVLWVETG